MLRTILPEQYNMLKILLHYAANAPYSMPLFNTPATYIETEYNRLENR
jgi:hypothetical protein